MVDDVRDEFFDLWENEGVDAAFDEMVELLQTHLWQNYPKVDEEDDKVAVLKRDFESDLPHRVVGEAVGCDLQLCRDIRWRGESRGVIDRRGGKDSKSIPQSRRQMIRERDDDQCVRCGDGEADLELHHIVPLSQGGFDHDDNLAMLCKSCHKKAHLGDFSTRRTAYEGRDEFWNDFVENYEP